jgi:hypothetical protein
MTTSVHDLVYGEKRSELLPGLAAVAASGEPNGDGMVEGSFALDAEIAHPLFRALMRAEAELLLEDATALGTAGYEERTPDQRRLDALLRLARRCAAAGDLPPSR